MKLLPRLVKERILIASGERQYVNGKLYQVEIAKVEREAEVWRGLAIHEYYDIDTIKKRTWRVTHVMSGKAILRGMRTRDEAIDYLTRVDRWRSIEEIKVDWSITEEQFRQLHYREEIINMLAILQEEINNEK